MPPFTSILCALDSSPLAPRVLQHAIGLAAVCDAELTLLSVVASGDPHQNDRRIAALLRDVVPAGAPYLRTPRIRAVRVELGKPADAIVEMARDGIDLIVAGTHSKSGLSRWLLGSTSSAILEYSTCATLLVPPGLLEIVSLGPQSASFRPGAVMAAIDLREHNSRQLTLASELAAIANQPLTLMTVAGPGETEAEATAALRARATGLTPVAPERFVVRHGAIADEIDHAAIAEGAGLVVMGLRARGEGTPGAIATAVLKAKDAVVLAVPAT